MLLNYRMDDETPDAIPLHWYGEYLWRTELNSLVGETLHYRVVARDAAGNKTSSDWQSVAVNNIPVAEEKPVHVEKAAEDTGTVAEPTPELGNSDGESKSTSDGGCAISPRGAPILPFFCLLTLFLILRFWGRKDEPVCTSVRLQDTRLLK